MSSGPENFVHITQSRVNSFEILVIQGEIKKLDLARSSDLPAGILSPFFLRRCRNDHTFRAFIRVINWLPHSFYRARSVNTLHPRSHVVTKVYSR